MTPAQIKRDCVDSWALAIAKLRAQWIADCRTQNPISRREAWEWSKMPDDAPRPIGEIVAELLPKIADRMKRRENAA